MIRDRWCAAFVDEVSVIAPTVEPDFARAVALEAYAINRTSDPREMAVVWLAWRKSGSSAPADPAASPPKPEDALAALFAHLDPRP
ncbi:MAG TPA: hypothetical protein VNU71_21685 [Burkholderiaceae bacterium]|nr:hypothetical protein [Burkholderiaceae bacterium]